jgi:hypothetical protein
VSGVVSWVDTHVLSRSAVDDAQVVAPVDRRVGDLPLEHEFVGVQRGLGALGELGVVAPQAQHAVLERDAVRAAHSALVEVLGDDPVAAGPEEFDGVTSLRAMGDLIERDAEIAALRSVLGATALGNGAWVALEGVPGIGKTALLAEAEAEAERAGMTVLRARQRPRAHFTYGWRAGSWSVPAASVVPSLP